ncbi:hypothetical protein [Comamonas sp.]|uniref:hypothetical protein n=1 Tax=Comamonas sp. TaxID=34028 RepID=UPI0028A1C34B|nr:hypothetical protein [Comamonas sp.]
MSYSDGQLQLRDEMSYGSILLFFVLCWMSFFAYWLLSRGPPRGPSLLRHPQERAVKLKNLSSKKHWARGEAVRVADDGSRTANLFRVAKNTFGEAANRQCIAFLVPEEREQSLQQTVSVVVDGLRIGQLSARDLIPFHVMLKDAGLSAQVTSCDAYIGGGGTALDGKKQRYSISLDVDWFET